jgi:hypothetical protein
MCLCDIYYIVQIDDPTPPEQLPCTVQTFVRPLDRFPPNFETKARANGKGTISPIKSERVLLNNLLGTFPVSSLVHTYQLLVEPLFDSKHL